MPYDLTHRRPKMYCTYLQDAPDNQINSMIHCGTFPRYCYGTISCPRIVLIGAWNFNVGFADVNHFVENSPIPSYQKSNLIYKLSQVWWTEMRISRRCPGRVSWSGKSYSIPFPLWHSAWFHLDSQLHPRWSSVFYGKTSSLSTATSIERHHFRRCTRMMAGDLEFSANQCLGRYGA